MEEKTKVNCQQIVDSFNKSTKTFDKSGQDTILEIDVKRNTAYIKDVPNTYCQLDEDDNEDNKIQQLIKKTPDGFITELRYNWVPYTPDRRFRIEPGMLKASHHLPTGLNIDFSVQKINIHKK